MTHCARGCGMGGGSANEIRGKTPGIVGYGKIGTQTGLLAESIGMRVIYHDIEALHAVLAGWRLRGAAIATLR